MQAKKILAVVMSLCLTAGAVNYGAPIITQNITAQAAEIEADCYSFNETTGVLTLKGEIDRDALKDFGYEYDGKVKTVVAEKGTILPQNSSTLFFYYNNCTSIDLSKADTGNVTNMSSMFSECSALTKLDISSFDTSSVTTMREMFRDCTHLTTLDLRNFDTSSVTDMYLMFNGCSSLTSIDVSSFDTSNVTTIQST